MSSTPIAPFSFARKRAQRARAASALRRQDFLQNRIAEDLAFRLGAVNRRFERALFLGAGFGRLAEDLAASGKVGSLFVADLAETLTPAVGAGVVLDPERLPFAQASLDLIVAAPLLHWANDPAGALIQARLALRPDGLFAAALFGGRTLQELRTAILAAEADIRGGASLRIGPYLEIRDLGALLQRAGFALPVVDSDLLTVRYRSPLDLLQDLRSLGETSCLADPGPPLTKAILARAFEIYGERFGLADGRVPATFEILWATAWRPHESQQKPLKPGSAAMRLADAMGAVELSAGQKANHGEGEN